MKVPEVLTLYDALPDFPEISDEMLERCKSLDDFRPILFEYYKYTAMVCVVASQVSHESTIWTGGTRLRWTVLVGLLSRCHRLMAANLEFFQDDRYGETTQILDRCLLETAVKVRWISQDATEQRLRRYLEDSIRADAELGEIIEANIAGRDGVVQKIEARMLRSLKRHMEAAGIREDEVPALRRMPDLASLIRDIGEARLMYTVIGKIGSHHVHGTWGSLMGSYLESNGNGTLKPRGSGVPSNVNQYVIHSLFVISACADFFSNCFKESMERTYFLEVLNYLGEEILSINELVVGDDREAAQA